ncbi:hypothetical protein ACFTZF_34795 [Streptomyces mirabilis]|uniref:hypothetical protein n=1 Tax=Streptomyces TaxID=1883 RepID=UPI0009D3E132|nr:MULTISPECIES: hypothetical protein [Streptomyces]KAF5997017.1 hypothetical protein BOG92_039770 [Streptomyces sp. WAC00263]MCX4423933.1 hypothetical protein [Streptomyces mirabilis]MCX5349521.1 hypothetical protein [Streptomyces mirabilis]QDN78280.1 hypothetical protein FNV64_24145 [Streptomyces sp. S1A1-7]
MGSCRLALCARLTLCAGAVLAAAFTPAAYAADGGVSVSPVSPAPGSDVQLRALGCTGTTGTAVSTAFVADARLTGQGGVLVGDTRVRSSATPGSYEVKVSCDGRQNRVSGTVTVTAPGGPTSLRSVLAVPTALTSALALPNGLASPVAPVHAGGGGTAHFASVDARSSSPGTKHAVIGLVLASAAAVAVAVRSARRGHDTRD